MPSPAETAGAAVLAHADIFRVFAVPACTACRYMHIAGAHCGPGSVARRNIIWSSAASRNCAAQYCRSSLDWRVMAWLLWPRAGHWLDRGRGPGRGVPDRGGHHSGRDFRRGAPAAVSGQRAGHAQPVGDPDQPAVQRRRDTRGAVPLLAAGTDRRAAGPGAHRRDPARRHRRIVHPGQADPRPARLRPGGRRRPDPAGHLAGAHPARSRR